MGQDLIDASSSHDVAAKEDGDESLASGIHGRSRSEWAGAGGALVKSAHVESATAWHGWSEAVLADSPRPITASALMLSTLALLGRTQLLQAAARLRVLVQRHN